MRRNMILLCSALIFVLVSGALSEGMSLADRAANKPRGKGKKGAIVTKSKSCTPLLTIITAAKLPAGSAGQTYALQIQATGQAPVIYSLVHGSLPPGLGLSSDGLISGVPTTAGDYTFRIRATDSCTEQENYEQTVFTLRINPSQAQKCTPLKISTAEKLPAGTAGQAYTLQIQAAGQGQISYSVFSGALPSGMNLGPTGLISGSPAAAGDYTFGVRATDSCAEGPAMEQIIFSLKISAAQQKCSSLKISTPGALSAGAAGQAYTLQIQAAGQGQISYSLVSGALPSGMNLSPTGLISGVPAAAGDYSFGVRATDSCPASAQIVFTLKINAPQTQKCASLKISTAGTLPAGTVGQSYALQIQATGQSPISYSLVSGALPSGMNLGAAGLISGVPAAGGDYNFVVRATDSCVDGATTQQAAFTLKINAAQAQQCTPLKVSTPEKLPAGSAGQAYALQIQATGQTPVTFSVVSGSMPAGLGLDPTGLISGAPVSPGDFSFGVRATDSCSQGAASVQSLFTLKINQSQAQKCAPLTILTSEKLPPGATGQAYALQLQVTGQAPVTYGIVSGSMPSGLSLSPAGLITGVPASPGDFSFRIRATDSCLAGAQSVEKTFSLSSVQIHVTASVTPSSFGIPRETSSLSLLYAFSSPAATDAVVRSVRGTFLAGGTQLGEVNSPLTVSLRGGTSTVQEALTVPFSVIKRAEDRGSARIVYARTFSGDSISVTTQAEIIVTTEAGADFRLSRIQIFFDNNRSEITVKRNQPLKARADIRFSGSGLLKGLWEVDGRVLADVTRQLPGTRSVIIEAPSDPNIPTFEAGQHRVRFVITSPSLGVTSSEAVYLVTAEEYRQTLPLSLLSPADNTEPDLSSVFFRWDIHDRAAAYLIEFLKEEGKKPVFSAYRKSPEYRLPQAVLRRKLFVQGVQYYWKVKSLDADGLVQAESPAYRFRVTK